ncbi:MAG TPA: hypothetical protein VHZ03_07950 [Trebonia sp.]|nr:hypothetical protein [Trebonia sp.]
MEFAEQAGLAADLERDAHLAAFALLFVQLGKDLFPRAACRPASRAAASGVIAFASRVCAG